MNFIDGDSVQYSDYCKLTELGFNLVTTKTEKNFTYISYKLYFDEDCKIIIGISYNLNLNTSRLAGISYWVHVSRGQESLLTATTSTLDDLLDEVVQATKK